MILWTRKHHNCARICCTVKQSTQCEWEPWRFLWSFKDTKSWTFVNSNCFLKFVLESSWKITRLLISCLVVRRHIYYFEALKRLFYNTIPHKMLLFLRFGGFYNVHEVLWYSVMTCLSLPTLVTGWFRWSMNLTSQLLLRMPSYTPRMIQAFVSTRITYFSTLCCLPPIFPLTIPFQFHVIVWNVFFLYNHLRTLVQSP